MSRNSYPKDFKKGLKKSKSDVGVSTALPVKILPAYDPPPPWIPAQQRLNNSNYNNNLIQFLPRKVELHRIESQPLGFNIRGGSMNEYGTYVTKVLSGSEAERVGLKRGDKLLSVNNVDFNDIEHEKAVEVLRATDVLEIRIQYFPYGFLLQQERMGII